MNGYLKRCCGSDCRFAPITTSRFFRPITSAPRSCGPTSLDPTPSARSKTGTERVQRYGGANQSLQCLLIDLVALAEVDRAPRVALEARVEEAGWVLERRPLGKGHLHDV